jgi:hypothetical protein
MTLLTKLLQNEVYRDNEVSPPQRRDVRHPIDYCFGAVLGFGVVLGFGAVVAG